MCVCTKLHVYDLGHGKSRVVSQMILLGSRRKRVDVLDFPHIGELDLYSSSSNLPFAALKTQIEDFSPRT